MELKVKIYDELNDETIDPIVEQLEMVYVYNKEQLETFIEPDLVDTVTLKVNSPGGYITSFTKVRLAIDKLKKQGVKIKSICEGIAYSCGALIFLLGDIREADELASIMIHQGAYASGSDRISANARYAKHQLKIQDKMNKFVADRTKIPLEELEKYAEVDLYFDYDEAMEVGILTPPPKETMYIISEDEAIAYFEEIGYKVVRNDEYEELKENLRNIQQDEKLEEPLEKNIKQTLEEGIKDVVFKDKKEKSEDVKEGLFEKVKKNIGGKDDE